MKDIKETCKKNESKAKKEKNETPIYKLPFQEKLWHIKREINQCSFYKDKQAKSYKYLSLWMVHKAIAGILDKYGVYYMASTETMKANIDEHGEITTGIELTVMVKDVFSDNCIVSKQPLYASSPKSREGKDLWTIHQAYGAAKTYAIRYALCGLLGIVGDDDMDGNAPQNRLLKKIRSQQEKENNVLNESEKEYLKEEIIQEGKKIDKEVKSVKESIMRLFKAGEKEAARKVFATARAKELLTESDIKEITQSCKNQNNKETGESNEKESS